MRRAKNIVFVVCSLVAEHKLTRTRGSHGSYYVKNVVFRDLTPCILIHVY